MVKLISSSFRNYYFAPFGSFAGLICFLMYFFAAAIALLLTYSNEGRIEMSQVFTI